VTDHTICDACECVSHCRKNGCIPVTPMPEKQFQAMDLHGLIMNIPAAPGGLDGDYALAYKLGHRDARHAAAELSLSATRKPALPLSTSVTSLQLELSAALEMAVRDRMLVKEKDALILTLASALGGLMDLECRDRIMPTGREWDAARAALSKVPQ